MAKTLAVQGGTGAQVVQDGPPEAKYRSGEKVFRSRPPLACYTVIYLYTQIGRICTRPPCGCQSQFQALPFFGFVSFRFQCSTKKCSNFWSRFLNCGLMSPLGGWPPCGWHLQQAHVVARGVEWLIMASNVAFRSAPFKLSCNPHHLIGCSIHSNFHVTH